MFHKNAEVVDAEGVMLYHDRAELESAYNKFFESTPDLYYGIENRTVTNNSVRDQIKVRENGIFTNKILIYEVREGKIFRITIG
jgi:hypothetical protein